mgnify:CR=1 FL=1
MTFSVPDATCHEMPREALDELLRSDEPAERGWLRSTGPDSALLRINYLKAVQIAQERQIQLLTSALTQQHEILYDVSARVSQLVQIIPAPDALAGTPWQNVSVQLLQLNQRLQRGGSRPRACKSGSR